MCQRVAGVGGVCVGCWVGVHYDDTYMFPLGCHDFITLPNKLLWNAFLVTTQVHKELL